MNTAEKIVSISDTIGQALTIATVVNGKQDSINRKRIVFGFLDGSKLVTDEHGFYSLKKHPVVVGKEN